MSNGKLSVRSSPYPALSIDLARTGLRVSDLFAARKWGIWIAEAGLKRYYFTIVLMTNFRVNMMNHGRRTVSQRLIACLGCLVLCLSCAATAPWAQPPEGNAPPPAPVKVGLVTEETVDSRISLLGAARPWIETRVASEEPGIVLDMEVEEGDYVQKGDVLCQLDSSELNFQVREAEGAFGETKAQLERAKREMERQEALISKASVAQRAYDDALFEHRALTEKSKQLDASLNLIRDRLRKKTVRAPLSGVVVERFTQVGEWLNEGDAVAHLFLVDPSKVVVPVPEKYIQHLAVGDKATIAFDALEGEKFTGELYAIIPKGDEAARTFPVHIRLANPGRSVKPGMLARVNLGVGQPRKALLVSKDAIVLSGAERSVVKINDGKAVPVSVRMGDEYDGRVEVEGELKPGDQVVVRGNERLFPGQPVRILNEG
ncbi:MAG: efflux RND transporter periplasmic adaptor subunit [Deltaproteobacteria bacterium]|nr:efflux RND transporter periplasmic adaptor subunit [Deltaproteobacteria bacterium]